MHGALPQVLSKREFAPAVAIALSGGVSGGSWRGAVGGAQRQIPARVEGRCEGEGVCQPIFECGRDPL